MNIRSSSHRAITQETSKTHDGRRMTKARSYHIRAQSLRDELKDVLPREEVRRLHRRRPWLHFAYVIRQFALLFGCGWVLWHFAQPWIWIPTALLMGFTMFNFTVLLHEQVHQVIFGGKHERWMRVLGILYAFPSGISATQFTRWHLDHHDNLGSAEDDPKRHYLSPKRVARWYKLLYCTPALFPIYFRAARQETASYEPALQKTIARERTLTIAAHLGIALAIGVFAGWAVMARVYVVPYFLVFPIAFTLNRLGQHYIIDPNEPANWSTRVDGNWFWRFMFLNSNYHLEHHYFQRVPFYNLAELNRMLRPYFEKKDIRNLGYGTILYHWFVKNHVPHTAIPQNSDKGFPKRRYA